jgi:hypothetical protein
VENWRAATAGGLLAGARTKEAHMTDDQLYETYLRFYIKVRAGGPLTERDFISPEENGTMLAGRALVAAALGALFAQCTNHVLMDNQALIKEIGNKLKT